MKRACSVLAMVMFGVLLATAPAFPQACSIGGHNETSENFATGGGWAIANMTPGTVLGAPSASHLIFSEVGCRGAGTGAGSDSSEFIEIYNPTANPVSLDHMYISDDNNYYKIVNGTYLVTNVSDFALRFPANLSLLPGRTLVLCDTKAGFAGSGASAAAAQIFLEMKDSNANTADDMILMTTNTVIPVTGGMMTNPSGTNGEWLVLYCWNGTSDLVCDIDYASWGANVAANPKLDKTGITIDGPDAGAAPSAYNADTAPTLQSNLGTVLNKPNTFQRIGGEVGELASGGNGCRDRVVPTAIDWAPVAGTPNIRFHIRWQNQDADNMSDPINGSMMAQEFGVFLPDLGQIGSFNVPPLQPNSFFDVFFEVPLAALPPAPQKILPGGGAGVPARVASLDAGPMRVTSNCPPDTNWAGNVDIIWSGPGQSGTVNRHYADLLTCRGGPPSYIHFRGSNCPAPMPWSLVGVCPGYTVTLVNEDFTPAPNPVPVGWSGWICVSAGAVVPTGTSCCFGIVFQCQGSTSTVDICSTACDWQTVKPVLTQIDWTNVGTNVHFHQRWQNLSASAPSDPVAGTMKSQSFGVFLPDAGLIGSFNVPPMQPNSFFDVFFDVPLASLPAEPNTELPGGGTVGNLPCTPPTAWHGNVDIIWAGAGGTGQANKHFGEMPVCPGAGPTYLHVETGCNSPLGLTWSISGLCPGFSATLVNTDHTPAPNPLPLNWIGLICVSAPASTPVGTLCCFKVDFACGPELASIDVCARTCDWRIKPVLTTVDWTNIGTSVRFHQRWTNPNTSAPTEPVSGDMSSQMFGVFLPNSGPIGHFDVPPMPPSSFFDVFFDVPLTSLPPEPAKTLPGGGPPPTLPCPPPGVWNGNVDVEWTTSSGTVGGSANYHFTDLPVCPGAGPSYVHFILACLDPAGIQWTINGLCPGFTATLVNEDKSPAPNPLPGGWTGWICVQATAATPVGQTCCFTVDLVCAGAPAQVKVCARTCDWKVRKPVLHGTDWKRVGSNVRFHMSWQNPDGTGDSDPVAGDMSSQPFGAFAQNFGPIGHFDVPPIPPSSFFDVFIEVPLTQLPPEPPRTLPGGGPQPGAPCPSDTSWSGNVDIVWSGAGGTGLVNRHFTGLLVCPGFGSSHVHALIFCTSAAGAPWTIAGLCPGWNATLLNEDFTPAPNPVPPNWTGWISVAAGAGVPLGSSCCFTVTFLCDGVPGVIEVCASACQWSVASVIPNPAGLDFGILRAAPNPSTDAMVIDFILPRAGRATVGVYDLAGKRVSTLFDGEAEAGVRSVRWDGRGSDGRRVSPGAYFVKLQAANRTTSRKIVMFR